MRFHPSFLVFPKSIVQKTGGHPSLQPDKLQLDLLKPCLLQWFGVLNARAQPRYYIMHWNCEVRVSASLQIDGRGRDEEQLEGQLPGTIQPRARNSSAPVDVARNFSAPRPPGFRKLNR